MANLEIGDLLSKLNRLRGRVRKSALDDIYPDLIEASALCEGLADSIGKWSKRSIWAIWPRNSPDKAFIL